MLRWRSAGATAGRLVAALAAAFGTAIVSAAIASPGRTRPLDKNPTSLSPPPHALSAWRDRTPARANRSSVPPAAEDCAAVYEPHRHRLMIFGGKDDRDTLSNQLWGLDLIHNRWQQIKPVGPEPPPTEDAVLIYDPLGDRLILHGGENGPTLNQVWSFDLQSRVWRSLTDSLSPRREEHSGIYDSRAKRMLLFGGRDNDWVDIR
ncbi:MAG TPA: kelch repeat-containing protein, partial [Gemmatimonadales bacterium]|nr:kelch repeat-containing protein [Gemmatimonadales bacterium]